MRNTFAIVVFLAVVLPVNGQQNSSKDSHNEQHNNNERWTVPCSIEQGASAPKCDWTQAKSESYLSRLLAPETVPNIALFVIGVFAVVAALLTLRTINRQADIMEKQDKAAKSKQRARIAMAARPDPPISLDMTVANEDGKIFEMVEVYIEIVLDGESNAYDVRATGGLSITTKMRGEVFTTARPDLECPKVIREATSEKPIRIALAPGGFGSFVGMPQSEMEKVREGNAFLHTLGQITYSDVFGGPHVTPFHFVWYVTRNESWPDEEGWTDLSDNDS